jgi:hypothetical protein
MIVLLINEPDMNRKANVRAESIARKTWKVGTSRGHDGQMRQLTLQAS